MTSITEKQTYIEQVENGINFLQSKSVFNLESNDRLFLQFIIRKIIFFKQINNSYRDSQLINLIDEFLQLIKYYCLADYRALSLTVRSIFELFTKFILSSSDSTSYQDTPTRNLIALLDIPDNNDYLFLNKLIDKTNENIHHSLPINKNSNVNNYLEDVFRYDSQFKNISERKKNCIEPVKHLIKLLVEKYQLKNKDNISDVFTRDTESLSYLLNWNILEPFIINEIKKALTIFEVQDKS